MAPLRYMCVAAAVMSFTAVHAADHQSLEEGDPTTLDDALVTEWHEIDLFGIARYDRVHGGAHRFVLEPRVQYGIVKNGELLVAAPYTVGNTSDASSGQAQV